MLSSASSSRCTFIVHAPSASPIGSATKTRGSLRYLHAPKPKERHWDRKECPTYECAAHAGMSNKHGVVPLPRTLQMRPASQNAAQSKPQPHTEPHRLFLMRPANCEPYETSSSAASQTSEVVAQTHAYRLILTVNVETPWR